MKVRQGFVSNSSSASFVLDVSKYDSTFSIAYDMIGARGWCTDKETIQTLQEFAETRDSDMPLSFRTCNYDTYITRVGPSYLVSACNNHSFHEVLDGRVYVEGMSKSEMSEEVQEFMNKAEGEYGSPMESLYDLEQYLKFFISRFFIEAGEIATVAGRRVNVFPGLYTDYCDIHAIARLKLGDGRTFCPGCESR